MASRVPATNRVLIIGSVGFAWRFLGPAWRRSWGAMAAASLVLGSLMPLGLWSPLSPWRAPAFAVALGAILVLEGGLYRLALGKGEPGPAGFQVGKAEFRLGAVWGLTAVFMFILGLLAFVVVLAFAFAVASSGHGFVVALPATWAGSVDGRGRVVVSVVATAALAGLIWAGTRVSLGGAASIDRERIQMLASWPLTRGVVAPMIAARLALGLAPIALALAIPAALSRAADPPRLLVWVASLASGLVIAGFWLPLSVGLMTYFYQRTVTV